jgi:hypothetical protein
MNMPYQLAFPIISHTLALRLRSHLGTGISQSDVRRWQSQLSLAKEKLLLFAVGLGFVGI